MQRVSSNAENDFTVALSLTLKFWAPCTALVLHKKIIKKNDTDTEES